MVSIEQIDAARVSLLFAGGALKFEQQALEILLQRRTELTASLSLQGLTIGQADAEFLRLLDVQSETLVAQSNALTFRSRDFRELLEKYTDQLLHSFAL
ncbi:hypothetical protein J2X19_002324 [Rhodoferax ferrireducens]|uniref:Uncharacterized protein n=1 Tax=Rhodoferax ferrireducens TaxID=192843 RepID=A0ABU2C8I4_9BURK|nr:hypothetical protein [Rhodoferax ferrireducens]MDR7377645.1 hypothetical protein [Rhodoferax ferrireducens]